MSRSIEELRAHIVKLDSEIDLQTKLLKNLERDKGLAQRQLNAALDPVARLPPEISSEIFLQSLSASPSGKQGLPTALLSICNAWTDIVLATPALWTTVHIHFPCGEDLAENLPMWFQRARNLPLSILITIRGPSSNWSHSVSDVLWRHGGQVKHLEILDNDSDLLAFSYDADGADDTIDLFGDTTSVSLPLLETLAIRCQRQQRMYNPSQIFQLLREAPNIVEFISHKVRTGINPAPETLVIPTLRRVIFGETSSGDDEIFLYLSLPALEALSLPMRYISGDELLACVKRSAAPLQDLALGWEFDMMESIQLHDCLRLIPQSCQIHDVVALLVRGSGFLYCVGRLLSPPGSPRSHHSY
ncbi:F-box domain-containing protein [Mycena sanguinolenta]|uniref:F-box domain-containing protein n=1 Tax=Mycena sanguinolenta TaxID=230812 RepID=A0A8H7DIF6_9AGAR|nr:F-box domain-containing protein [Mycena sanguinolenta]